MSASPLLAPRYAESTAASVDNDARSPHSLWMIAALSKCGSALAHNTLTLANPRPLVLPRPPPNPPSGQLNHSPFTHFLGANSTTRCYRAVLSAYPLHRLYSGDPDYMLRVAKRYPSVVEKSGRQAK